MSRRRNAAREGMDGDSASQAELQAAQLKIEQMLALLEIPGPRTPVQYRGVQGGLVYALQDLLSPLQEAAPETSVDRIAAVLGFPGPSNHAKDMPFYSAAANTTLTMTDRLAQLVKEELPGKQKSALAHAQEHAEKLSPSDQNDIALRLRKKSHAGQSGERERSSDAPNELVFEPHGTWLEQVEAESATASPKEAATSVVGAFNVAMHRDLELERAVFPDARSRVRAWVAAWHVGGEVHVELRDIGLVAIGLDDHDGVRITRVNMLAPTERTEPSAGTSRTLLPSRFAYFRELSDHLLVHALRRDMPWVRALSTTLLHCAALSTLFDPLPGTTPGRTATATLDPRKLIDRATCVVYKWCHVTGAEALPGAWYAYAPVMIS